MGIIIREAKTSDAETLTSIALSSKAHWGYSEEFMDSCRAELTVTGDRISSDRYTYFGAELDGELVGFYGIEWDGNDKAELEALFVEPSMIGRGIGRKLVEHSKAKAGKLGVAELLIQGDPHAEKFYMAAGAELIGQKESGSIPGRMLPLFMIRLGDLGQ